MTPRDPIASSSRRRPSLSLRPRPRTAAPSTVQPPALENEAWNRLSVLDAAEDGEGQVVEEMNHFPEPVPRRRGAKSFSSLRHPVDGLRALGRRLSVTIRNKSSRHASHHQQEGHGLCHDDEHTTHEDATLSRHSWCKGSSINRRASLNGMPGFRGLYTPNATLNGPIPGNGLEPPIFPNDMYAGAAARAAAAAQNEMARVERDSAKLSDARLPQDSESGIGIDLRDRSEELSDVDLEEIVRLDPAKYLPTEIMSQVFSYLDPQSLMQSELVSHAWRGQASSRHIWRQVFRRVYGHSRPSGISSKKKQSAGLGKTIPNQDWKRMFFVRRALDDRWKEGKAAAIYLHGHTDSVYCAQFDEYVLP